MDLIWLLRNIKASWLHCNTLLDFFKRLLWIYSNHLPAAIKKNEWIIGLRYREPIGLLYLLVRSNLGSDSFIHGEVFELGYYDLGLPVAPDTILDLGANIGLTCIHFARWFPQARIAAVEPVSTNLRLLRKNLAMNHVSASLFAGAIDVEDGRVTMDVEHKDYGHRVLQERTASKRTINVAAYSVPTLLRELGWDRIGLLKVDIEGHEKALLSHCGSWINLVDAMCIECHEEFGEAQLRDFALRSGFRPPQRLPGIWLLVR
jgi:FkbM family methyltransferase